MRTLIKILWQTVAVLLGAIAVLLLPVIYNELGCRGTAVENDYTPIITDTSWQRNETRTLLSSPEWHIVHAYDNYARVIEENDPHDFSYGKSILGFWSSPCAVSVQSASYGGFDTDTKSMVYTIGVSFTVELLLKALYEETIGRITTRVQGDQKSSLDILKCRPVSSLCHFSAAAPLVSVAIQRR